MSYGLYTNEETSALIIKLVESYQGEEDDIHNLLDSLVDAAYNRGTERGFDLGLAEGVQRGREDEFESQDRKKCMWGLGY